MDLGFNFTGASNAVQPLKQKTPLGYLFLLHIQVKVLMKVINYPIHRIWGLQIIPVAWADLDAQSKSRKKKRLGMVCEWVYHVIPFPTRKRKAEANASEVAPGMLRCFTRGLRNWHPEIAASTLDDLETHQIHPNPKIVRSSNSKSAPHHHIYQIFSAL